MCVTASGTTSKGNSSSGPRRIWPIITSIKPMLPFPRNRNSKIQSVARTRDAHTQTHVPHLYTPSQGRGQKAWNKESERQENYKARTSQTQTQNPSAHVRPSLAHGIGQESIFWQLWHPQPRTRYLEPTLHYPHTILFFRHPNGGQNPETQPTYWSSCDNKEGSFGFEGRRSEESTRFAMTAVTGTTGRRGLWTRYCNKPGLKELRLDYARN